MVNYVCRTCLYVCDNEFSFRKLEKVKPVLELFVPEIRNCVGNYSLICEQCYYFLKNVEKFKVKCMETQNKLYSMNLETIRDNHDSILKAVANEVSMGIQQGQKPHSNLNQSVPPKRSGTQVISTKDLKKAKCDTAATTTPAKSDITLSSILQSSEPPKNAVAHCSVSNDLDQLLSIDKCIDDMQGFREFALKPTRTPIEKPINATNCNEEDISIISDDDDDDDETNNKDEDDETSNKDEDDETSNKDEDDETSNKEEDDETSNKDEDDEYMTRKDLVAAGILSDYSDTENEGESENDVEIIESKSKGKKSGKKEENQKKIGGKNGTSEKENNIPNRLNAVTVFKTENIDDENPGFFNKQSPDGYYKCKLCDKQYKTSKGLYRHTKEKHGEQIRFHHCNHCSFFTLWKSALTRHSSVFHEDIFEGDISAFKCYHCTFETLSKQRLSSHILDRHGSSGKYVSSTLCPKRVEQDMPTSSNYCRYCRVLFLTDEESTHHLKEKHGKWLCVICMKTFGCNKELYEHQRRAHATSLGASASA